MMSIVATKLPPGWYKEIVIVGVDPERPGIYEWRIEGVGVYIGQYGRARRPRSEYKNNVSNILSGRPYRKGKPDGFRAIHRELAEAVRRGYHVTLTLLENVADKSSRNRRERELIADRRKEEDEGGLPVLNSNERRVNPLASLI